jgi:hypothetical protein
MKVFSNNFLYQIFPFSWSVIMWWWVGVGGAKGGVGWGWGGVGGGGCGGGVYFLLFLLVFS